MTSNTTQFNNIKRLLLEKNAVLIAHYYVDAAIQQLAEDTGGIVADSLDMARFGYRHQASTLVVAGVRFMGETAKILSPEKRVLMPTLDANCSLDLGCHPDEFARFKLGYPDRKVVVYANTSAAVKAQADWVVTSSNALEIISHLSQAGEKILWAPDRFLGSYIQRETQADMVLWQSSCIVHEEFKAKGLQTLRGLYPDAAVLVHPESPQAVVEQANVVGSTKRLLKAVSELPNEMFIVATDRGILYQMKKSMPNKTFIEAPTAGEGAACKSCAHCPWMAMNQLDNLQQCLEQQKNEILLDTEIIRKALVPLERMVNFTH